MLTFIPTTATPSFSPTTAQPISLPDRPTNQLPICRDGSTLHCSCQWTLPQEQEHMFLEGSPVSNEETYQPESVDTVLPSLCSEISYQLLIIVAAVGWLVAGTTLMYFFTRASKETYVYPNRTEYAPIMEHE